MQQIDMAFLENFTGGDKVKMSKYIKMFLDYAPAQVEKMKTLAADKEWSQLKVAAHSMKPQISYMGIKGQEAVIKKIEQQAEEQIELENMPVIIENLGSDLQLAYAELQDVLNSL